MLQVSESFAHIWDPNSVYIEAIHSRRGLKSTVDTLKLKSYICVVFALKLNPFISVGG